MRKSHPAKIGIPDSKGIVYVTVRDIHYLESMNGYTRVVTKDGAILSSFSIGKFVSLTTLANFYQVHRSYIINLNFVSRYRFAGDIVMQDNKEIPVSKTLRADFLNLFYLISSGSK
jgi:two-component system, LytTR family, response regulator